MNKKLKETLEVELSIAEYALIDDENSYEASIETVLCVVRKLNQRRTERR